MTERLKKGLANLDAQLTLIREGVLYSFCKKIVYYRKHIIPKVFLVNWHNIFSINSSSLSGLVAITTNNNFLAPEEQYTYRIKFSKQTESDVVTKYWRILIKRLAVSVALLLFVISIFAQSIHDTIHIGEVSVIAQKKLENAGLKITHPDTLAFQSTITTDLSELISGYTPIFVKSYGKGSSATASFRGTAPSHTQVLWNGMNLNSPMRGSTDLSLLPVFFVDDALILHGGSSLSEGSGALGGSISLKNLPDWQSKFEIKGIYEVASFDAQRSFLSLAFGGEKLKTITRAFYEMSENNFPFYNYAVLPHRPDTQQNAAYWKAGVLQEFYLRPVINHLLALRFWYQKGDRDLPPLMSYEGGEREETQKDSNLRINFNWKWYHDSFNLDYFSGFNSTDFDYFRKNLDFDFVINDSRSSEIGYLNKIKLDKKFSEKVILNASLDANYYKVEIDNRVGQSGYSTSRFESGLMFNIHVKPSDRLASFLLLRSEYYDKKFISLIPSVGMEWQMLQNSPLLMQLNVSRNFHKPTLNDLFWLPGGNPDLKPEDGFSGDISLSWEEKSKDFSFNSEVTFFASRINDWIVWQPASNGAYYWEANNLKQVFSRGIEYQATGGYVFNNLKLDVSGNYSFTRTSNLDAVSSIDDSRGKQLIYIPKHAGNFYTTLKYKTLSLRYSLNYTGRRYTTSSNQNSDYERVLNPYWLSALSLQKIFKLDKLEISVRAKVENLLDINYQSILWRAMPGRNYSLTMGFKFRQ